MWSCAGCVGAVHRQSLLLICAGHPAQGAGGSKKGRGGKGREEVAKEGESEMHRALEGGSGMGEDSQADEKCRRGLLAWPRCSGSSLAKEALQHLWQTFTAGRAAAAGSGQQLYLGIKNKGRRGGE